MRTRQFALALSLTALALAGCGRTAPADNAASGDAMADTAMAPANDSLAANAASTMAPVDTPTYVARAGAGDLFERESSKAVLETTKDANVRKFAQMMIDQHTQSTDKIKAAADAAGLTVAPPKLDPAQQAMLDQIKGAQGPGRDAAYLRAQATAHADALALHQGYASGGDNAALKTAAGQIAGDVQKHIAELEKLNAG